MSGVVYNHCFFLHMKIHISKIAERIEFEDGLAYQETTEGTDFTIKCKATGHSRFPRLYWKVDDRSPQGIPLKIVLLPFVQTPMQTISGKQVVPLFSCPIIQPFSCIGFHSRSQIQSSQRWSHSF